MYIYHKISHWIGNSAKDQKILSNIEKFGSIHIYLKAKYKHDNETLNKFEKLGFSATAAEQVLSQAKYSKLEDLPFNIFQTMLDMYFYDLTVVGNAPFQYRCFDTHRENYTAYEFERWMGSMFQLSTKEDQNCFLLAHFKYSKESIKEFVKDLSPNMKVFYNNENIVIPLNEITIFTEF
jgi:hypothetical protein